MISSAILAYPIQPIKASAPIDKNLAEALLASLAEYHTQLRGRRIWLACSGGRDSLALAALCSQLYQQGTLPFLPQLLHVDHGLQSDSSVWAMHVAKWAQAQQLSCHILRATVNGHDEQAARQARYQVMLSHMKQNDVLLLAHHADDQAETVLMRLIQGAGVKGLSGMQPWRVQTSGRHSNNGNNSNNSNNSKNSNVLWRPWLTIRRANISAYAERLQLPYIDDPTNDSGDNVRSSLRGDIMPALAVYNPNVIDNIARSAQLLADAQATVSAQAEQDLQRTTITSLQLPPVQRVLSIPELQRLPCYRQRQLLHYWLALDEPLPPSKQLIDDVLMLVQRSDPDHQTQLNWQGRKQQYIICRYRQQLYRLSNTWLSWLSLPLIEHTLTLSNPSFSKSNVSKSNMLENKLATITLRSNEDFTWQLPLTFDHIEKIITRLNKVFINDSLSTTKPDVINGKDKVVLKIASLSRQQRVQTVFATRPQSGKKLYQTLGIPLWLRDSLTVVSMVGINIKDGLPIDLPILLLSPFNSWLLGVDKSVANNSNSDSDLDANVSKNIETNLDTNDFYHVASSILSINDKL